MDNRNNIEEEHRKEVAYYKKQLDKMSGQTIRFDRVITSMRHSLKQKGDVFAVLTLLQKKYTVTTPVSEILAETIHAITTNLGMDRAVALEPVVGSNRFRLSHHYGYPPKFFTSNEPKEIELPKQDKTDTQILLVNKKTPPDETGKKIQSEFGLNYFVGLPIQHEDKNIAFILTGRMVERAPFSPALDKGDVDSLTAITNLVNAVLQNKKAVELELQKTEVEKENKIISAQRDMLEKTLSELKSTQQQLIHAEKMASLGELTAGIAHEIQNPLNFVNNFSELNGELIVELKEEIENEDWQEVKAIAEDIAGNEDKIKHHGKRAEGIVKGMLQHSRTSKGEKEPTNINALADEYLRLAYHGLKAKDKSFNSAFELELDEALPKINTVPQDIGRVLLNLINNAFYVVAEASAKATASSAEVPDIAGTKVDPYHKPLVIVSTKNLKDTIEIRVKDNGSGIPDKIQKKIFQPFFTTKPTGEGTGLGLSLAYDIITKGHGGDLKVETQKGKGTEFIIQLPII